MPLVSREKIDDVRERTNIVEVTRRYVDLKRAGTGSWKGLCPFHAEKTPSFHVHEQRQFFNCFGCGEKGDVFKFLQKIEQRSFMEVLRDLAEASGVELPEASLSPAERKALSEAESERERMIRVVELATRFFEGELAGPAGAAARAYLDKRAISEPIRQRFRLGYAPSSWNALQGFLASHNVPPQVAEQLGLVGVNERGRYDFFRDRVMLPVIDRQKRVVGYSSRLLDPEAKAAKYVNSPDSPLFHKKEQLYGLNAALDAIRKASSVVVVEGNFDVMSLHEAGIEEAVAPMGTALTMEQVRILGRLANRVVVLFDGDEAGRRAARKVVPLFVDADVDGRVARMPAGVDPDELVRAEGAAALRRIIDNARPMLDQFIDDLVGETDSTIPGRVRALEAAAPLLARVGNRTERELYANRLATALAIPAGQVMQALRSADSPRATHRIASDTAPVTGEPIPAVPAEREPPRDELELLALLVAHPELLGEPDAARAGELLVDPAVRALWRAASETAARGDKLVVGTWLDDGPADVHQAVARAVMDDRFADADNPARVLCALTRKLELLRVEAEIAITARQHREALERGDEATARAISLRELELIRTKQGLRYAPQRP